jgi:simple sugar transport system substrate-binding protein
MVHAGVLTGGYMWNPAQAGEVFVTLGDMLVNGETLEAGMDIPGLGVINPNVEAKDIITDNLLEINEQTVDELADKGL